MRKKRGMRAVIYLLLVAIYVWAFAGIPVDGLKDTAGQVTQSILKGLFAPDWDYVYLPEGEDLLRGLLDTFAIAVLGTFISAVLCVPFAFWSASHRHKSKVMSGSGKMMLSFIRTFPEIVMAILFIKAVGPGSLQVC